MPTPFWEGSLDGSDEEGNIQGNDIQPAQCDLAMSMKEQAVLRSTSIEIVIFSLFYAACFQVLGLFYST